MSLTFLFASFVDWIRSGRRCDSLLLFVVVVVVDAPVYSTVLDHIPE